MFNWIKRRKATGKLFRRKGHRQDRPRQTSFRPRLEPLEKRELLYAGALDQSFGFHGMVLDSTFDAAWGWVALQADGKILWAGASSAPDLALKRFNPDGTRDSSFGFDPASSSIFPTSIAIQACLFPT